MAKLGRRSTVAELAARYLKEYADEHSKPNTVKAYRRRAEKQIVPALGKPPIGSVRRDHVRDLHYAMRSIPTTANRTLNLLSQMFNMAESWGLMPEGSNPCRRKMKHREFLTAAEFRRGRPRRSAAAARSDGRARVERAPVDCVIAHYESPGFECDSVEADNKG